MRMFMRENRYLSLNEIFMKLAIEGSWVALRQAGFSSAGRRVGLPRGESQWAVGLVGALWGRGSAGDYGPVHPAAY
jgi:hypothetical protein